MSVFWNPQDPLGRSRQAVTVLQVNLVVCEATSGVALTNVGDLEAALEVA